MTGGPWNYAYDGNGLRVEKSNASGGTMYWRALSGETIAESDLTGSTTNGTYREYIFFASRRIASRDSATPTPNIYFYYTDQLGSTITLTSANGTPCYQATFTPYGEEHTTQTACSTNYKFARQERDNETGLDYAFARYYNSRLARFMSADPLGGGVADPQSLNRYAYVGNSPLNFIDPLGMEKCPAGEVEGPDGGCIIVVTTWYQPPPSPPVGYGGGEEGGGSDGGDCGGAPCPPGTSTTGFGGGDPFTVDFGKLLNCTTDLYGVLATSFTPSKPGSSGSFEGFSISGGTVNPFGVVSGSSTTAITVINNGSTFTLMELPGNAGNTGSHDWVTGYTDPAKPYTNFTASNITAYATLQTQIVELGNSLALISGTTTAAQAAERDKQPNPDPNGFGNNNPPGQDLLKCPKKK